MASRDIGDREEGRGSGMDRVEKMLKDPAAPKRPMSSFFLFGGEERPRVREELGNIFVG